MAFESVGQAIIEASSNESVSTITELIYELGSIGKWLQALGIIVILWIIFQIINFIYNYKKRNQLKNIEKKMSILESKIDKLDKKIK